MRFEQMSCYPLPYPSFRSKKLRDVVIVSHLKFIDAFACPNLIIDGLSVPIGFDVHPLDDSHGHVSAIFPGPKLGSFVTDGS
jgi:hypothetical protein